MTLGQSTVAISTTLIIVAGIVLTMMFSLKGCADARQKYYEAYEQCVSNGGTWIDRGDQHIFTADCIALRK